MNIRNKIIDFNDAEMDAMFEGMAVYNTGQISVAYRKEVVISKIRVGHRVLSEIPFVVAPCEKLVIVADLNYAGRRR